MFRSKGKNKHNQNHQSNNTAGKGQFLLPQSSSSGTLNRPNSEEFGAELSEHAYSAVSLPNLETLTDDTINSQFESMLASVLLYAHTFIQ